MSESELIQGESIYMELKPHPLAYWYFYLFFLYYVIASGVVLYYRESITYGIINAFSGILGEVAIEFVINVVFILLMWAILVLPAIIFSVLRIAWKWTISFVLFASLLTYLFVKYGFVVVYLYYIIIIFGLVGIFMTEIYRKSHVYVLTNFRIIATEGFPIKKTRDIFYNKLSDLFVNQGFLGKIFNFGTVIPVTPSGIGTGQDAAQVSVGVGVSADAKVVPAKAGAGVAVTGTKTVTVPRGRESFILYGIGNPWDVRKLIISIMKKEDPVTYLKEIVGMLKKQQMS